MDARDELGSEYSHILKRKRTKRQRSSSPFVAAATTSSSTGGGGRGGGGAVAVSDDYNYSVSSPTTTTISSTAVSECTEEEEDMAICLIMLARGAGPPQGPKNSEKHENIEKVQKNSDKTQHENSGFYVYQCKTCNRTFPSFQALGGHRASHKKPRTSTTDEKTKSPLAPPKSSPSEEGQNCQIKITGLTLASPASNNITTNSKPSKIHECSICKSEFTSGQALGGHMRRHRTATAAGTVGEGGSNRVGASSRNREETSGVDHRIEPRKYLSLDLNLPAPEDDIRETKFQGLVFPATPALVDCHY